VTVKLSHVLRRTVLILRSLAQMICALTARRFSLGFRRRWSSAGATSVICYAMRPRMGWLFQLITELSETAWRGPRHSQYWGALFSWAFSIEVEFFYKKQDHRSERKTFQRF
jgi:hypothetical protein